MSLFPLWLKIATVAGLGISTIAYLIEVSKMDGIIESILNKPEKRKRRIMTAYRAHFILDKIFILLIPLFIIFFLMTRNSIPYYVDVISFLLLVYAHSLSSYLFHKRLLKRIHFNNPLGDERESS